MILITAALMLISAYLLALSWNGAAVIPLGTALVLVVVAFARHWKPVALGLAGAICAVVTWATLDGGAEDWTALPWAVGAVVLVGCAAVIVTRTVRSDRERAR